jgi:hypothetical protein
MTKLLALGLLAMSATASAQQVAQDGAGEPREPTFREVDARLGMMGGGADVGDADGGSIGVSGGLGYRVGDTTVRATLDYFTVGDDSSETLHRRGRNTRIGAALRRSFAHSELRKEGHGGDFWGEVGIGYEHVAWRQGGILDRPSGSFALGFDGVWRDEHPIGYFVALRSLIAQGPDAPGAMPTCGGPCSEATKPSRTDLSLFFELGVHWGR